MYDTSDRFLHQLAADRRASLLRAGEASTKRPFRRALRAGLARLGLVADRNLGEAPSLDGPRPALTNSEGMRRIQSGSTESAPGVGEPAAADVAPGAGASTTRLRHGAQQA